MRLLIGIYVNLKTKLWSYALYFVLGYNFPPTNSVTASSTHSTKDHTMNRLSSPIYACIEVYPSSFQFPSALCSANARNWWLCFFPFRFRKSTRTRRGCKRLMGNFFCTANKPCNFNHNYVNRPTLFSIWTKLVAIHDYGWILASILLVTVSQIELLR